MKQSDKEFFRKAFSALMEAQRSMSGESKRPFAHMSRNTLESRLGLMSLAMAKLMKEVGRTDYKINTQSYEADGTVIGGRWDEESGDFEIRLTDGEAAFPEDDEAIQRLGLNVETLSFEPDDIEPDEDGFIRTDTHVDAMDHMPRKILEQHLMIALLGLNKLMDETNRLNMILDTRDRDIYTADMIIQTDVEGQTATITRT